MGAGVEHEQPRVAAVVDPDVDPAAGVVEVEALDVASGGVAISRKLAGVVSLPIFHR